MYIRKIGQMYLISVVMQSVTIIRDREVGRRSWLEEGWSDDSSRHDLAFVPKARERDLGRRRRDA